MQQNTRYVQASVQINGVQQYVTVDQFDGRQSQQQPGYNGRAGASDVFRGKQLTPVHRGPQQSFAPPVQSYTSPLPIPMVKAASRPVPMTNEASRQRQQQPQQYQQSQVGGKRGSMLAQAQSQDSLYPKRQRYTEGGYSNPLQQQMGSAPHYNLQGGARQMGPALLTMPYPGHQQPGPMGAVEPLPAHLALRDVQHLRCMLANIMQEHLEKDAFPDAKTAALSAAAAVAAAATKPLLLDSEGDAGNAGDIATAAVQHTEVAMPDTAAEAAPAATAASSMETVKLEESLLQGSDLDTVAVPSHSDAAAAEPCAATTEDAVPLNPASKQEVDCVSLQPADSVPEAVPNAAADVDMPAAAMDTDGTDAPVVDTVAAHITPAATAVEEEMPIEQESVVSTATDIVPINTGTPDANLDTQLAVTHTNLAAADTDMSVAEVELAVTVSEPAGTTSTPPLSDFARKQAAKVARKLLSTPAVGYAISCVRPEFNRRFHRDLDPKQHGFLRLAEFVAHVAGDMVIFNKDKAIMLLPKPGFDYSKLAKGGAGTPAPPPLLISNAADVKQKGNTAVEKVASSPAAAAIATAKLKDVAAAATAAAAAPSAAAAAPVAVAATNGIPAHLRSVGGPVVPFGTRIMTTPGNEITTGKLIKIAAKIVRRHVLLYRFQMYRSICKELGNTLRLTAPGPTGSYTKQDVALSIVTAAAAGAAGGAAAGAAGGAKLSAGAVVAALLHKKREELAEQLGPSFCFEMQDLAAVLVKAHPALATLKAATGYDLQELLETLIKTDPGLAFKLVDPLTNPNASVYKPDFLSFPPSNSAPAGATRTEAVAAAAPVSAVAGVDEAAGEKSDSQTGTEGGNMAAAVTVAAAGEGDVEMGSAAEEGVVPAVVEAGADVAAAPRLLVQPLLGSLRAVQMVLEAWQFVHTKLQELQAVPGVSRFWKELQELQMAQEVMSSDTGTHRCVFGHSVGDPLLARSPLPSLREEFKQMFRHPLHLADIGFADLIEFMDWPLWRDTVTVLDAEVKGEKGYLVPTCSAYKDLRELLVSQMTELVVAQRENGVYATGLEHPGVKVTEIESLFRQRYQYDLDPHRLGYQSLASLVRIALQDVVKVVESDTQGATQHLMQPSPLLHLRLLLKEALSKMACTETPFLAQQLVEEFKKVYGYSLEPSTYHYDSVEALLQAMPDLVSVQESKLLPPASGADELNLAKQIAMASGGAPPMPVAPVVPVKPAASTNAQAMGNNQRRSSAGPGMLPSGGGGVPPPHAMQQQQGTRHAHPMRGIDTQAHTMSQANPMRPQPLSPTGTQPKPIPMTRSSAVPPSSTIPMMRQPAPAPPPPPPTVPRRQPPPPATVRLSAPIRVDDWNTPARQAPAPAMVNNSSYNNSTSNTPPPVNVYSMYTTANRPADVRGGQNAVVQQPVVMGRQTGGYDVFQPNANGGSAGGFGTGPSSVRIADEGRPAPVATFQAQLTAAPRALQQQQQPVLYQPQQQQQQQGLYQPQQPAQQPAQQQQYQQPQQLQQQQQPQLQHQQPQVVYTLPAAGYNSTSSSMQQQGQQQQLGQYMQQPQQAQARSWASPGGVAATSGQQQQQQQGVFNPGMAATKAQPLQAQLLSTGPNFAQQTLQGMNASQISQLSVLLAQHQQQQQHVAPQAQGQAFNQTNMQGNHMMASPVPRQQNIIPQQPQQQQSVTQGASSYPVPQMSGFAASTPAPSNTQQAPPASAWQMYY